MRVVASSPRAQIGTTEAKEAPQVPAEASQAGFRQSYRRGYPEALSTDHGGTCKIALPGCRPRRSLKSTRLWSLAAKDRTSRLLDQMKLEGALQRPYTMWAYNGVEDVVNLGTSATCFAIAEPMPSCRATGGPALCRAATPLQNHVLTWPRRTAEETARLMIEVPGRQRAQADFQTHLRAIYRSKRIDQRQLLTRFSFTA